MKARDITFNEDLVIINGDFQVSDSDGQHIEHIIRADRGQFRQFPFIGVGAAREIGSSRSVVALKALIKLNLKADNYTSILTTGLTGDNREIRTSATRLR